MQALIEKRQAPTLAKLETSPVTGDYVLSGVRDLISRIETYGLGSWQASALTKLWELLGKATGLFKDRIELGFDEAIMAKLLEGRQRARLAEALPEGKELDGNVQ